MHESICLFALPMSHNLKHHHPAIFRPLLRSPELHAGVALSNGTPRPAFEPKVARRELDTMCAGNKSNLPNLHKALVQRSLPI